MPQIMLLLEMHPCTPWSKRPGVCWTAVSSAGTQWEKLTEITSGLSFTGKAAVAKALVSIFYCAHCI